MWSPPSSSPGRVAEPAVTEPAGDGSVVEYELVLSARGRRVRAVIADVGAAIRRLSINDVDLTPVIDGDGPPPYYCGTILAPWANRVRDGRWTLDGRTLQLDITDPEHHAALHGLLTDRAYRPTARSASSITLGAPVRARDGYPFDLDTEVRYELAADGLAATQSVRNVGSTNAPIALGAHPFLTIGDVPTETLTLTINGAHHIDVDEQLIPVGVTAVTGTEWDLRAGRRVAELDVDDCWSVVPDEDGGSTHTLRSPDGRMVSMWADAHWGYVHVFVTHAFHGYSGLTAVAVEPMTAAADAFNNGAGLRWLAPGEALSASWAIRYDDGS